MRISEWIAASAALIGGLVSPASAEEKPLWEAGLGVGIVSFPEYRGSSKHRTWVLPTPYFVYRGKILKTDRGGVRGAFFDSEDEPIQLRDCGVAFRC